jgi:hypothetical protein
VVSTGAEYFTSGGALEIDARIRRKGKPSGRFGAGETFFSLSLYSYEKLRPWKKPKRPVFESRKKPLGQWFVAGGWWLWRTLRGLAHFLHCLAKCQRLPGFLSPTCRRIDAPRP